MNWLDIVLLVLIAIPTLLGLRMGIIKTVLSLAGVILGIILGGRLYPGIAAQLTFISHPGLANIVAFAVVFLIIMIIAGVLASILRKIISLVLLGWVDHLGGAACGFLIGAVFCGAILATWVKFLGSGAITSSALAMLLLDRFPMVLALLPEEFDAIRGFFN